MSEELIDKMRNTPAGPMPGWGKVPEYTNWQDEQMSWKQTCYLGDWSFLAALEIEGPDALKLFSDITVNSFAKFDIGQAKHVIQCNEQGKVLTDGIIVRLGEEKFCVQSVPAFYTAAVLSTGRYEARARYADWFFFQVQGPKALSVIKKLFGDTLDAVGFMRFQKVTIRGHEVYALRQGMSGELGGFEFQGRGGGDISNDVYDALFEAGQEFGIRKLGTRSAMINHNEAWYPTVVQHYLPALFGPDMEFYREYLRSDLPLQQGYPSERLAYMRRLAFNLSGSFEGGNISDYYRSPVELGWTKNIRFDHNFVGRQALEEEVAHPRRVGVTLEFNSDDIVEVYRSLFESGEPYTFLDLPHHQTAGNHASKIISNGEIVGFSSYPVYSFYFRKVISISTIDVELREVGTQVEVVWGTPGARQKYLRATVAPAPYKKDNRRAELKLAVVQPV